jgi:hypothetical protein
MTTRMKFPKFDVYVGVNFWTTVDLYERYHLPAFPDIIHVPSSDNIYVCLINTGSGIPFHFRIGVTSFEKVPLSQLTLAR